MILIINQEKFLRNNPDIKITNNTYYCRGSGKRVFLPNQFSNNLCRFIGIMHGDGNLSYRRIHITDEDPKYHRKILQPLVKNLFNLDLNLYFDENRGSYYSHVKSSVIYRYLLECLGFSPGSVRDSVLKKIPSYLYDFDSCQKSHYIAGLYDAEGHIKLRQIEVDFSITSYPIREYIVDFFDNHGLNSTPYRRERIGRSSIYEIYIYGKHDVEMFNNLIPILHPAKVERLNRLLNY
ncbi:MAG: LAGLIDADG family homing endonuclease [Promethearchaeota archaeon]